MFFGICQTKNNHQRKNSILKHAVVNNNKFSSQNGIKNGQVIKSRFQKYKLMKSQIINHKKTKFFHLYYMTLFHDQNLHQEKNKQNILHKHSQSKYLFI